MKRNKAGQVVVAPDAPSDVMGEVGEVLADLAIEEANRLQESIADAAEEARDKAEKIATKKYIENFGGCPACNNFENIHYGDIEMEDEVIFASRECSCPKCHTSWKEEFKTNYIYKIEKEA